MFFPHRVAGAAFPWELESPRSVNNFILFGDFILRKFRCVENALDAVPSFTDTPVIYRMRGAEARAAFHLKQNGQARAVLTRVP